MSADFPSPKFVTNSQEELFWESALNDTMSGTRLDEAENFFDNLYAMSEPSIIPPAPSAAATSGIQTRSHKPIPQEPAIAAYTSSPSASPSHQHHHSDDDDDDDETEEYVPHRRSTRVRTRATRSKTAPSATTMPSSAAASSAAHASKGSTATSSLLRSKDGKSMNQNALNAKLNRERIKAERMRMESDIKTLTEQLAESRRSEVNLMQQVEAAKMEIRQLQTALQASPHVGKLLEHLSGITMSFNSQVDAGQKRAAEDAADASCSKRVRSDASPGPVTTIPLQFNLQLAPRW